MMSASPVRICCMPMATSSQPRAAKLVKTPGGRFLPHAAVDRRLPRWILALAGRQYLAEDDLVDLVAGPTLARSTALFTPAAPSSWAGMLAKAPLNAPTAVLAALAMTMSLRAMSDRNPFGALRCAPHLVVFFRLREPVLLPGLSIAGPKAAFLASFIWRCTNN